MKIPNHVGFILDGNGRWAQDRGLTRSEGHQAGFDNLQELSKYIFNKGVKVLSVYAFSTENFKRSKQEVDFLMRLFVKGFKKYEKELKKENIKIVFSGIRKSPLPADVLKIIREVEESTKDNTAGIFNICVNYDSQWEIVDATKKIIQEVQAGNLNIDDISKEVINSHLYQDLPPIDLLIRTSGENRLSGFMLWQASYAEFYFPSIHFPAFKPEDFDKALEVYNGRDRRFGGINEKKTNS
ncbi:MAG: di-trans,poly-cis-decaprenylcistransferase [Firmicutes bacterium]|nr:di-trans,poly-cis-decaprenylcistransferase [Bacillota bacterium]